MRKFYFFIFIAVLLINQQNLSAQVNLDFEQWTTVDTVKTPNGWFTNNAYFDIANTAGCMQSTQKVSGQYSALVFAVIVQIQGQNFLIPGFLAQQDVYKTKPVYFNFSYKYDGIDTGEATVEFYKNNTAVPSNRVGISEVELMKTHGTFKNVNGLINWTGTNLPDSVIISFTCGMDFNSFLWVDNVSFSNSLSTQNIPVKVKQTVLTVKEKSIFIAGEENYTTLNLFDMSGKLVHSVNVQSEISKSVLSKGYFMYQLVPKKAGEAPRTGKIVIQ